MNKTTAIVLAVVIVLAVAWLGWSLFGNQPASPAAAPAGSTVTSTAGAQNQFPPTQTVVYMPAPPASSTPVEDGSCWTNSIAAPFRADAWRCSIGNSIEDPCFEIPGNSNDLLCGVNPARPDATSTFVLHLTQPLPAAQPLQGQAPSDWAWLVELSDGTLCSPFTGTLPVTATGESANYGCAPKAPGGEGLLIFGDFTVNAAGGGNGNTLFATVGTLVQSTSGLPTIVSSSTVPVATIWQ
jgi:hypothetical protein